MMRQFQKDKGSLLGFAVLCAAFFGGILSGIAAYLTVGTLFLFAVILFFWDRKRCGFAICLLLLTLLSFLHAHVTIAQPRNRVGTLTGERKEIVATVAEADGSGSCIAELISVDGVERSMLIRLHDPNAEFSKGEQFCGKVTFSQPPEEDDGFPTQQYLLSRGVFLVGTTEEPLTYLGHTHTPAEEAIDSLRGNCRGLLRSLLEKESGLGIGLLLGNDDFLPPIAKRDLTRSGALHLLAVSGLHLSTLFGAVSWLLFRFRMRRQFVCFCQILFLAAFAVFTGCSPSVLRAGAMATVAIAFSCFRRRPEPIPTLLLSAACIVLIRPLAVFDLGFQLSVACVWGIFLFALPIERVFKKRIGKGKIGKATCKLCFPLFMGLGASIGSLPIFAYSLGEISWIAPLAGLFLIPLASLALLLLPPSLLLHGMGLPSAVGAPCRFLLGILRLTAKGCSAIPNPMLSLRDAYIPFLLFGMGIFGILVFLLAKRRSRWIVGGFSLMLCVLLSVNGILIRQQRPFCTVSYFEEDGAELLLFAAGKQILLADLSAGTSNLPKTAFRFSAETHRRVDIDTYLLSEYNADSVAPILAFCGSHLVRELLLPTPQTAEEQFSAALFLQSLPPCGTAVRFYAYGENFTCDALVGAVVSYKERENAHAAVALWMGFDGIETLYMGARSNGFSPSISLIKEKITKSDILITGNAFSLLDGSTFGRSSAPFLLTAADVSATELAPQATALVSAPVATAKQKRNFP